MTLIGYISLNEEDKPHRKPRSGYSFHTQDQKGYHPPRIYTEESMAKKNSPVGKSIGVYINEATE